ncbi:hypothetical protein DL764_000634 [Monosporascus ibericus]|uniref:Pre-mRNA-splicing factor n=1 Tax=Monosporascus ibericus TaxID=155417 RepID=A0A4Q4TSS9_9PEZI|nr:hypothetical protein DL764_000634 [Monosporascus ibericus]
MSEQTAQAPRIAIKFGTNSFTAKPKKGLKNENSSKTSSSLGKRQRSHAFSHDSDSAEDDELGGRHEVVTTFGANGAENDAERRGLKVSKGQGAAAPLVISGHKNRDWKSEAKARKGNNLLPHEVQVQAANQASKETDPADQDKQIKWGLTVTKKERAEISTNSDEAAEEKHSLPEQEMDRDSDTTKQPNDVEGEAMDALLGKKRKSARDLIIKDASGPEESPRISEQDAYRRGLEEAAEVSTIEEYDAIPDGEFGAAMLRGMGWKGEERAPKPKEHVRRPHLMGLGAKEDEELKKAEMAKKGGHRERRPRLNEYRASKESERRSREDRRPESYKNERDREKYTYSHGHRNGDRDRDRGRDRESHRSHDRHHRY